MKYLYTYSSLNYIALSLKKIKFILNEIRKKSYKEVLLILELLPYKVCEYIFQILFTAISNLNYIYIKNLKDKIYIDDIILGKGPMRKQIKFLAKGRIAIIKKKTCNIKIFLSYI